MKKLLLPLLILTALSANAKELSVEQAEAAARQFIGSNPSQHRAAAKVEWQLAAQAQDAYYVFNTGNTGFVVACADSDFTPVLGYSENGSFDPANVPPALTYMLGEYEREMKWMRENGVKYAPEKAAKTYTPIAPLMTTQWGQNDPYNQMCPSYYSYYRCVAGCMAVAMAQIMKYHNWPVKGTGSNTYEGYVESEKQTLSSDFSAHTYDWNNMLNQYYYSATSTQKKAVAQLCFDCGIGVNTNYGGSSSSSYTAYALDAMRDFFGYDKGIQYWERLLFDVDTWTQKVYESLRDCGPVLYTGDSEEGGHAFVFDGIDSRGYFHVNWGWQGLSDGYFLLTMLNPDAQGTGGSGMSFNNNQSAIFGIQKPKEGSVASEPYVMTKGAALLNVSNNAYQIIYNPDFYWSFIYNPTRDKYNVALTNLVSKFDSDEIVQQVVVTAYKETDANNTFHATPLQVDGSSLTAGRYKVRTGYVTKENPEVSHNVFVPYGMKDYVVALVDNNGNVTYFNEDPGEDMPMLKLESISLPSAWYTRHENKASVKITNNGTGDFNGELIMNLQKKTAGSSAKSQSQDFFLAAGDTFEGDLVMDLTSVATTGNYNFWLSQKYSGSQSDLSDKISISLEGWVAPSRITLSATELSMKEGETATLYVTFAPNNTSDKSLTWLSSDNTVASVDNGVVTAIAEGTTTISATTINDITATCTVTVEKDSGVEELYADPNADVQVFNLFGVKLCEGKLKELTLPAGIYIVSHATSGTAKMLVK